MWHSQDGEHREELERERTTGLQRRQPHSTCSTRQVSTIWLLTSHVVLTKVIIVLTTAIKVLTRVIQVLTTVIKVLTTAIIVITRVVIVLTVIKVLTTAIIVLSTVIIVLTTAISTVIIECCILFFDNCWKTLTILNVDSFSVTTVLYDESTCSDTVRSSCFMNENA